MPRRKIVSPIAVETPAPEQLFLFPYATAAALMSTTVSALRKLVKGGKIKHLAVGHRHLISADAIREFIQTNSTDQTHSELRPARLRTEVAA